MAIRNLTARTDRACIACDGCFTVTLGLEAGPEQGGADIVMLVDRSGSMAAREKLTRMQEAAGGHLDMMTRKTGGVPGRSLGSGYRLALISYADQPVLEQPLQHSVEQGKARLDALCAGGCTNHGPAFQMAAGLLAPCTGRERVIAVYTDDAFGDSPQLRQLIRQARQAGITVYCFSITTACDSWGEPCCPRAETPVCMPAEAGGKVQIRLAQDFELVRLEQPSAGRIEQLGRQAAVWTLGSLGVCSEQRAVCALVIRHVGTDGGEKQIFRQLTWRDGCREQAFAIPSIRVECGCHPCEDCFTLEHCQDCARVDLGDLCLTDTGRMILVHARIKAVCPGRALAVAVQLTEVGRDGQEIPRGMKVLTVPPHQGKACRDVELSCIRFILPEEDPCGGLCRKRLFRARIFANYLDHPPMCCRNENDPTTSDQ